MNCGNPLEIYLWHAMIKDDATLILEHISIFHIYRYSAIFNLRFFRPFLTFSFPLPFFRLFLFCQGLEFSKEKGTYTLTLCSPRCFLYILGVFIHSASFSTGLDIPIFTLCSLILIWSWYSGMQYFVHFVPLHLCKGSK